MNIFFSLSFLAGTHLRHLGNRPTTIDPFSLYREPIRISPVDPLGSPVDPPALEELLRLSVISADGAIVNAAIAAIYQRQGRYREAMRYTDSIIGTYPESHLGYTLKADLLCLLSLGTEATSEAVPQAMLLYKKAVERSEGETKTLIEMKAGICGERLEGKR